MAEMLQSFPEPDRRLYHLLHWMVNEVAELAFNLEVVGPDNVPETDPALLACDHRSALDPIFLSAAVKDREVRQIARHEWLENPVLKFLMEYFQVIPIHRDEITEEEIDSIIQALVADRRLVGIFAESTRRLKDRIEKERAGEDLNRIAPLRPGVAIFARKAKVPTVPVVITGLDSVPTYRPSDKIWDPLNDGRPAAINRRVRKFTQQSVIAAIMRQRTRVTFGEPIEYPNSIKARKDFLGILSQTMRDMREDSLAQS